MRTATTIVKDDKKGWSMIAGPDVHADKQRASFASARSNWPSKSISEIRLQFSDGKMKVLLREKHTGPHVKTELDHDTRLKLESKDKQTPAAVETPAVSSLTIITHSQ